MLLFDEPTSALDPTLVGEVLHVMAELAREGSTMIVVTHEMAFAREAADRVYFIEEGVFLEGGPPQQVIEAPQRRANADVPGEAAREGLRPGRRAAGRVPPSAWNAQRSIQRLRRRMDRLAFHRNPRAVVWNATRSVRRTGRAPAVRWNAWRSKATNARPLAGPGSGQIFSALIESQKHRLNSAESVATIMPTEYLAGKSRHFGPEVLPLSRPG